MVGMLYSILISMHGKGRSVPTYGTPGVRLKFVGKQKKDISKHGLVTKKRFKQFAKGKYSVTDYELCY